MAEIMELKHRAGLLNDSPEADLIAALIDVIGDLAHKIDQLEKQKLGN